MNAYLNVMHTTTCNCAACAPVPTLGIKMPYEEEKKELVKTRKGRQKLVVGENDLATVAPKVAAMLSEKDKHFAFEVTAGSKRKLVFVCPNCGQEFEATIQNVVRSVNHNLTGCPVCAGKKIVPGVNDLASKYPEIAAMWSGKNKLSASEVAVKSNKKVFFKCRDCGKEFETKIEHVVYAVENGTTGCPVCNGRKVVPGINDLASRYPKVAAMWSNKNEKSALEVTAKTDKKAIFKCPDCGKEFKAQIGSVVDSVKTVSLAATTATGGELTPFPNRNVSWCVLCCRLQVKTELLILSLMYKTSWETATWDWTLWTIFRNSAPNTTAAIHIKTKPKKTVSSSKQLAKQDMQ